MKSIHNHDDGHRVLDELILPSPPLVGGHSPSIPSPPDSFNLESVSPRDFARALGYHLTGTKEIETNPGPGEDDISTLVDFVHGYKSLQTDNHGNPSTHPCSCSSPNDAYAAGMVTIELPIAFFRLGRGRYKTSKWTHGLDQMARGNVPCFFDTETLKMHSIEECHLDKVKNSLIPIAKIKDFYKRVGEEDSGKPTRAGAALGRRENEKVAYFNGEKIDLRLLTMGTSVNSSNKLLIFADEKKHLSKVRRCKSKRVQSGKTTWSYIKVQEVLTDVEILAIGKLAGEISPPLQIYFLLVACKYKQYIMERTSELVASQARGNAERRARCTTTLVPKFEELIQHIRTATIDIATPKMEILRLTWEDWVDCPGNHNYASYCFHIAMIMLVSGSKGDRICRQGYTNTMSGMRGPKDILCLMKAEGERPLSLCGLAMALTEILRPTSLYLSGAISMLDASVLSCLYFGGGFPTNEIHAAGMEQLAFKKSRIILNSITQTFHGVGCDVHVLNLVRVLARELGVASGLTDGHITHHVCGKDVIGEDVGYYANEIVGQLKQWWSKPVTSKEREVCREIVKNIGTKNEMFARVLEKFLSMR